MGSERQPHRIVSALDAFYNLHGRMFRQEADGTQTWQTTPDFSPDVYIGLERLVVEKSRRTKWPIIMTGELWTADNPQGRDPRWTGISRDPSVDNLVPDLDGALEIVDHVIKSHPHRECQERHVSLGATPLQWARDLVSGELVWTAR